VLGRCVPRESRRSTPIPTDRPALSSAVLPDGFVCRRHQFDVERGPLDVCIADHLLRGRYWRGHQQRPIGHSLQRLRAKPSTDDARTVATAPEYSSVSRSSLTHPARVTLPSNPKSRICWSTDCLEVPRLPATTSRAGRDRTPTPMAMSSASVPRAAIDASCPVWPWPWAGACHLTG
jgi:hypothetical protein